MISKVLSKVFGDKEKIQTVNVQLLYSKEEHDRFWVVLRQMYRDFLKDDDKWHFFFEGDYNHIRCRESSMKKVVKTLYSHEFRYTEPKEWKDNSSTVRLYADEFTALFHNFSEIAMKFMNMGDNVNNKMHLMAVADRVFHCFMNHMYYRAMEMYDVEDYRDTSYEVDIMSDVLKNRALYIGWCKGVWKANDDWEKKIEAARQAEKDGYLGVPTKGKN